METGECQLLCGDSDALDPTSAFRLRAASCQPLNLLLLWKKARKAIMYIEEISNRIDKSEMTKHWAEEVNKTRGEEEFSTK